MKRIAFAVMLVACGRTPTAHATAVPPVSTPMIAAPPDTPAPPTTPVVYADPATASHHVTVKAKLLAIRDEMPMCGGIHFGTVVEYEVIAVEAGAIDSLRLLAAVGCIQLPRRSYDTNAGKLEKFQVGDVHRVTISNDKADSRGMSVMATPQLFYVISADPA